MDQLESFSPGSCDNCVILIKCCEDLQNQVKLLSEKLDSLTNYVLREKTHTATQCNVGINMNSVSCCTDDLNRSCTISTQTAESVNPAETSFCNGDLNCSFTNSTQTETLLDIFLQASNDTSDLNTSVNNQLETVNSNMSVIPYKLFPDRPFEQFNPEELDKSCEYQVQLENRHLSYYGQVSYSYSNINHRVKPIESNNYLCKILDHLKIILPDFNFNSVLITKFRDGNDYLSFHSDNEPSIHQDSQILTISLGETRTVQFSSLNPLTPHSSLVEVSHGSVYCMSRESQNFFKHCVPKVHCSHPRISITLRYLNLPPPLCIQQGYQPDNLPCLPSNLINSQLSNLTQEHSNSGDVRKPTTLFISSSMFSNLDDSKLSSPSQNAVVLFYRGATAGGILARMKNDPKFLSLQPKDVNKVFVMCGSNNVDQVLEIPFSHCSVSVKNTEIRVSENKLNSSLQEIDQLYQFLLNWNPSINLNFVNVLPRVSLVRNKVINILNEHIYNLCAANVHTNFISTEKLRNLFAKEGFRRDVYFSNKGSDNVHLNRAGVIRLGKHLKFLAHV